MQKLPHEVEVIHLVGIVFVNVERSSWAVLLSIMNLIC